MELTNNQHLQQPLLGAAAAGGGAGAAAAPDTVALSIGRPLFVRQESMASEAQMAATRAKLKAITWQRLSAAAMEQVQVLGQGSTGDVTLVRCNGVLMARKRFRTAGKAAEAKATGFLQRELKFMSGASDRSGATASAFSLPKDTPPLPSLTPCPFPRPLRSYRLQVAAHRAAARRVHGAGRAQPPHGVRG